MECRDAEDEADCFTPGPTGRGGSQLRLKIPGSTQNARSLHSSGSGILFFCEESSMVLNTALIVSGHCFISKLQTATESLSQAHITTYRFEQNAHHVMATNPG